MRKNYILYGGFFVLKQLFLLFYALIVLTPF